MNNQRRLVAASSAPDGAAFLSTALTGGTDGTSRAIASSGLVDLADLPAFRAVPAGFFCAPPGIRRSLAALSWPSLVAGRGGCRDTGGGVRGAGVGVAGCCTLGSAGACLTGGVVTRAGACVAAGFGAGASLAARTGFLAGAVLRRTGCGSGAGTGEGDGGEETVITGPDPVTGGGSGTVGVGSVGGGGSSAASACEHVKPTPTTQATSTQSFARFSDRRAAVTSSSRR